MSEVNALKTLRDTTLAYLSESDYENIIKAVGVGGIDSLTGTASMIVKSAVLKHGSHDQSSHNPKKGGGGGGGSSSEQSDGPDNPDDRGNTVSDKNINEVKGSLERTEDDFDSINMNELNDEQSKSVNDARDSVKEAYSALESAGKVKGKNYKTVNVQEAETKLQSAFENLEGVSSDSAAAAMSSLEFAMDQISEMLGEESEGLRNPSMF